MCRPAPNGTDKRAHNTKVQFFHRALLLLGDNANTLYFSQHYEALVNVRRLLDAPGLECKTCASEACTLFRFFDAIYFSHQHYCLHIIKTLVLVHTATDTHKHAAEIVKPRKREEADEDEQQLAH